MLKQPNDIHLLISNESFLNALSNGKVFFTPEGKKRLGIQILSATKQEALSV
jgi:hypothetical protein